MKYPCLVLDHDDTVVQSESTINYPYFCYILNEFRPGKTITLEEYQAAMEGIYTTSVNVQTLDEAPMAYKSLEDIIDVIRETVDVIDVMKPIYNFKAN